MMMPMMNTMMNGGMGSMMSSMFLSVTLWILGLSVLIWALITWLNRSFSRPQPVLHTEPSPSSSYRYEQSYAPAQPLHGSPRERERSAQPKEEFDHPYVPYAQEQELPPQF